jgi:hypothetical protein
MREGNGVRPIRIRIPTIRLWTLLIAVALIALGLGAAVAIRKMSLEERSWLLVIAPFPVAIVVRRLLLGWALKTRGRDGSKQ